MSSQAKTTMSNSANSDAPVHSARQLRMFNALLEIDCKAIGGDFPAASQSGGDCLAPHAGGRQ